MKKFLVCLVALAAMTFAANAANYSIDDSAIDCAIENALEVSPLDVMAEVGTAAQASAANTLKIGSNANWISTALNAASIAWTVTQIASGCYVSGILGGAIMLSSTYLGAQQRTSQLCEEKNRKALDDAKRSLLSEYFSDFD